MATSRNLTLQHLDFWAGVKGIAVTGTGDVTHPAWYMNARKTLLKKNPTLCVKARGRKKNSFST